MIMKCCHGCVPPKRHTACWGHCPEYIEEKAECDRRKKENNKRNAVSVGIYRQKIDGVFRAVKRHGRNRKK